MEAIEKEIIVLKSLYENKEKKLNMNSVYKENNIEEEVPYEIHDMAKSLHKRDFISFEHTAVGTIATLKYEGMKYVQEIIKKKSSSN